MSFEKENFTLAFMIDLSGNLESNRAMGLAEGNLHDLIESCPIPVCLTQNREVIKSNDVFYKLFGYESFDEVDGFHTSKFQAPSVRENISIRIKKREEGEYTLETYVSTGLKKDGSTFKVRITAKRTDLVDGVGIIAFFEEFE